MKNNQEIVYLIFLLVFYFILSVPLLNLPGVSTEEAFLVINAAGIIKGQEMFGDVISLFGIKIPIMMHEHVGIISSLVYVPSFFLFGANVYTMRLTRIFFGFICILLSYYFAKFYFNRKTAIVSSLLMATLPFFIFLFRHGFLDDGLNPVFMLIFFVAFFKFNQTKKSFLLYISFFSLGLGLSSKLNFIWFIISLIFAGFFFRKDYNFREISKKQILFSICFFFIGALPIIIFNLNPVYWNSTESNTIEEIIKRIIYPEYSGNNLEILKNLLERANETRLILNNNSNRYVTFKNFIYLPIMVFVFSFFLLFKLGKVKLRKRIMFFLTIFLIMFFLSLFTITTLRIEHHIIYIPILFTLFSYFLVHLFEKRRYLLYFILTLITLFNLISLLNTYMVLNLFGEFPENQYLEWYYPSDSIYSLVDFLLVSKDVKETKVLGYSFWFNAWFLSDFKVMTYPCETTEGYDFNQCIDINSNSYYILKLDTNAFHLYEPFRDILLNSNKTAEIKKVFYRRDNVPEFLVIKVSEGKDNASLELKKYIFAVDYADYYLDEMLSPNNVI